MRHESTQTPLQTVPENENQSTYAHLDASSSNSRPLQTPYRDSIRAAHIDHTEVREMNNIRRQSEADTRMADRFGGIMPARERGDRNRFYSERQEDEPLARDTNPITRTTSNRPLDLEEQHLSNRGVSGIVSSFALDGQQVQRTSSNPDPMKPNRKRLRRVKKGRQTFLEMISVRSGTPRRRKREAVNNVDKGSQNHGESEDESEENEDDWTEGSISSDSDEYQSPREPQIGEPEDTFELQEQDFDARMNPRSRNNGGYHYKDSSNDEEEA
jgi:hypothetical protein